MFEGITSGSKDRNANIVAVEGLPVHPKCRRQFTNKEGKDILKRKKGRKLKSAKTGKRMIIITTYFIFLTSPFSQKNIVSVRSFNASKRRILWKHFCRFVKMGEMNGLIKLEYYVSDLHAIDNIYHRLSCVNFGMGNSLTLI